jgi:MFS family permease
MANSAPQWVVWRVVQALGAGGGMIVGAVVVSDLYRLGERGTALGVFFTVSISLHSCNDVDQCAVATNTLY